MKYKIARVFLLNSGCFMLSAKTKGSWFLRRSTHVHLLIYQVWKKTATGLLRTDHGVLASPYRAACLCQPHFAEYFIGTSLVDQRDGCQCRLNPSPGYSPWVWRQWPSKPWLACRWGPDLSDHLECWYASCLINEWFVLAANISFILSRVYLEEHG